MDPNRWATVESLYREALKGVGGFAGMFFGLFNGV